MRIGIDLGGTKIEAIALADDGSVRAREGVFASRAHYLMADQWNPGFRARLSVRFLF